jgi:hypothetical protein
MILPSSYSSIVILERSFLFGFFRSVLGAALLSVLNAYGVQSTADDVIPNSRKVLHPPPSNENNGVLLEVVANPRDISSNFHSIGQPYPGNLSKCGIRFFGSGRIYPNTYPSFLGRSRKSRG